MADPTRPEDVRYGGAAIAVLAVQAYRYQQTLTEQRLKLTAPLPREDVETQALAGAAHFTVLGERAEATRFEMAVAALEADATHERVAEALGIADPTDMCLAVGVWVSAQRRRGLIDAERHDRILALLRDSEATP